MTYRSILYFIISLTIVVLVGSLSVFLWAIGANTPASPRFDLQGASGVATIVPAFAGVLLASFAIYMYIRVEDPLLKKSEEILFQRDVLMRLLDDVPMIFFSSIEIGKSLMKHRPANNAVESMAKYFARAHQQLDQMTAILNQTGMLDFLIKKHPEKASTIREFPLQVSYFSDLLKEGATREPISGAEIMILVCDTCRQFRAILDSVDVSSAHEIFKVLRSRYIDEVNPYDRYDLHVQHAKAAALRATA